MNIARTIMFVLYVRNSWHSRWCQKKPLWRHLKKYVEILKNYPSLPLRAYWNILKILGYRIWIFGMSIKLIHEQTTFANVLDEMCLIIYFYSVLAYHSRMNRRIFHDHPNIWKLVHFMQAEEKRTHLLEAQWTAGALNMKNHRTDSKNHRINQLYARFENGVINASELLFGLSLVIGINSIQKRPW